jgi:hypothetical protein
MAPALLLKLDCLAGWVAALMYDVTASTKAAIADSGNP